MYCACMHDIAPTLLSPIVDEAVCVGRLPSHLHLFRQQKTTKGSNNKIQQQQKVTAKDNNNKKQQQKTTAKDNKNKNNKN